MSGDKARNNGRRKLRRLYIRGPSAPWYGWRTLRRQIFGFALIFLGIVLSLPGVPGQGLLTIFLGVLILEYPGKSTLIAWLARQRWFRVGRVALRRKLRILLVLGRNPN